MSDFITEKCNSVKAYSKAVISFYDSEGKQTQKESIIVLNPAMEFDEDTATISLMGQPDSEGNMIQFGQLPETHKWKK